MLLKRYIKRLKRTFKSIKDEVLICKYMQLVARLIECMEEESWAFSEAAEYLMFSKKEYFDCIKT